MKTLITGSSGFLGTTLINDFSGSLGDVIAVSRSHKHYESPRVKSYATDICSPEFTDIVQENSPTVVVHTAARSIVRDCEQNPVQAFMVNVQGTVNVLESVRKMGLDIPVIVLETDKVYGQQPSQNIPTREDHPLMGWSPYEYSKVMTAQVCDFYRRYYDMKIYSLRPANIYGYWDTNKSRIIPNTITKFISGENPVVYSDSRNQLREYVYVNDACSIILSLASGRHDPGAYNISSGIVKSPEQVIDIIRKAGDYRLPTLYVDKPFSFYEINNQALSGRKLREQFYVEFTSMEDAMKTIWTQINERGYGA